MIHVFVDALRLVELGRVCVFRDLISFTEGRGGDFVLSTTEGTPVLRDRMTNLF